MSDDGVWIKFGKRKQYQTLVSEDQISRLKDQTLCMAQGGYARIRYNGKLMMLSHFVAGKPPRGYVKDHINHVRLQTFGFILNTLLF